MQSKKLNLHYSYPGFMQMNTTKEAFVAIKDADYQENLLFVFFFSFYSDYAKRVLISFTLLLLPKYLCSLHRNNGALYSFAHEIHIEIGNKTRTCCHRPASRMTRKLDFSKQFTLQGRVRSGDVTFK